MNAWALFRDDAGATMVEYAIMLAFIAAICITLVLSIGSSTKSEFSALASLMDWGSR